MAFKVGDKVRIKDYNEFWNGTEAEVVRVAEPGELDYKEFPYEIRILTDTPKGHRKAGELAGRWGGHRLQKIHSPQEKALAEHFPNPIDIFYSKLTDTIAVLDEDGRMFRILPSGFIDEH